MKNSILKVSISVLIIGTTLTNCTSHNAKESKEQNKEQADSNNFTKVQSDSTTIQQDTIALFEKFINESEERIIANEKSMDEIKAKIANVKAKEKSVYEKNLAQLEQKNKALKIQIMNYKNNQIKDWNKKQVEFKKDMDELGVAIANFFEKDE